MNCYHGSQCLNCECVKRFLRGEKNPCTHGGRCVTGCIHIEEAMKDPAVKELIDSRECADLMGGCQPLLLMSTVEVGDTTLALVIPL